MNKNKQVSHSKQETISIIFTHPWVSRTLGCTTRNRLGTPTEHPQYILRIPRNTPLTDLTPLNTPNYKV